MKKVKTLYNKNRNFFLYIIIGLSASSLDAILFIILHNFLLKEISATNPMISKSISLTFGITFSFFCNLKWNFKSEGYIFKRFVRFYTIGLTGFVLAFIANRIFVDIYNINPNIVNIGVIVPTAIIQYILNKTFSFFKTEE